MNFEFASVTRIVFGRGTFARVGELAAPFGSRALIVHNGSDDLVATLAERLSASKITSTRFRQKGEPTVDDIDHALDAARSASAQIVIGIGGGSAIDAAKAVAGLLTNGGAALDYMEVVGKGQKVTKPAAPFIAIPTTAGTGAEVTKNAVIGYPAKHYKASIRSELLLAKIALVDPELTLALPPEVTARTGMDALCQLIEGYTSTNANPMTDALALEGIKRAARSLKIAYDGGVFVPSLDITFTDGSNLDAREDMSLAALLSGLVLANAGLGAAHGLAAPLGATHPIPHGTACAALLAPVITANMQALESSHHPAIARYHTISRIFPSWLAGSLLSDKIRQLCNDLQIPKLRTYGLTESDFPGIIALAQKSSSMRYNPVPLPDSSLHQILLQTL